MELTGADFDAIPPHNLHVPRVEFATLWLAAETHMAAHPTDWYGAGVVVTCRWLADATVRPTTGPWRKEPAPTTRRQVGAYEELIEAECLATEKVLLRRPPTARAVNQPGWFEAILATLNWAWHHGAAPLDLAHPAVG